MLKETKKQRNKDRIKSEKTRTKLRNRVSSFVGNWDTNPFTLLLKGSAFENTVPTASILGV
jgi:hypothetical protein